MLHSFKKWVLMLKKKKKVFENSSFSIKHSALSGIWTNPHLQKEIPLQSILGSPEEGKHFTIFLGEKELPEYFIGLMGNRKIQESLVSLVFKNQRDHVVHFFFFLPFIFTSCISCLFAQTSEIKLLST